MFAKINTDSVREVPQTEAATGSTQSHPEAGKRGRTGPEDGGQRTVGDAAGWAQRMPPPGRKAGRDGPEGFIPSDPGP